MAKQEYCSICGNQIASWASGVCYSCGRMRYREPKGSWKPTAGPRRERYLEIGDVLSFLTDPKIKRRNVDANASSPSSPMPDWRELVAEHLIGINALLRDVYQRDVRLSQLMLKSGIPANQIATWRGTKSWILSFLLRLEEQLCDLSMKIIPSSSPNVFRNYYIDGISLKMIAQRSDTPIAQVEYDYSCILKYLQSETGIAELERIVVECTRYQTRKTSGAARKET